MMVQKESFYTYVNKKDKSLYTVSTYLFLDEDKEVKWEEDSKTGHYYPVAYDLDGKAMIEQELNQNKTDQETTRESVKKDAQAIEEYANEKSETNGTS